MKLYADKECWEFKEKHPEEFASFGCGPGGWGDFVVPDKILGVSVKQCCEIHDWYYRFYWQDTEEARERADRIFLNNMNRVIRAKSKSPRMRKLRFLMAAGYYKAVRLFGASAYFDERNPDLEYREV